MSERVKGGLSFASLTELTSSKFGHRSSTHCVVALSTMKLWTNLINLKAIFDFLFTFMAHRLLTTALEPGRRDTASSCGSSSLPSWGGAADAAGACSAARAAAARARSTLLPEPPLPQDSMELRRDLSVSVVPLSLHHATTYRRAPATHSTSHVSFHNTIQSSISLNYFSVSSLCLWSSVWAGRAVMRKVVRAHS